MNTTNTEQLGYKKFPVDRTKLNARFHQLLTLNKCDADEKRMIVLQCTNRRTMSAKDMTEGELQEAIGLLTKQRATVVKKMQAKAINTAKRLGIVVELGGGKMDWRGLNTFCDKTFRGKKFYELTFDELRHCITGLEKWQDGKLTKAIKEL